MQCQETHACLHVLSTWTSVCAPTRMELTQQYIRNIYTQLHMHADTHENVQVHPNTHTQVYMYAHTCTHTHMHTRMHTHLSLRDPVLVSGGCVRQSTKEILGNVSRATNKPRKLGPLLNNLHLQSNSYHLDNWLNHDY